MEDNSSSPVIVWFRQDLRVYDNLALAAAFDQGASIIPIYIIDPDSETSYKDGKANDWWLNYSLKSLNDNLNECLCFFKGSPVDIISKIKNKYDVKEIYWNICYEPEILKRDKLIQEKLENTGVTVHTFNSTLLIEPNILLKKDNTPYKVFTPFYKKNYLSGNINIRPPINKFDPKKLKTFKLPTCLELDQLNLLPTKDWYKKFEKFWQPGEKTALRKFDYFLKNNLKNYKSQRNRPDLNINSKLSPHIHFGEISINHMWHQIKIISDAQGVDENAETFLKELGWRDFFYYTLYNFPQLPFKNMQSKFDSFSWQNTDILLNKWKKGQTGYPFIDAGMRQLWQTGYIHGRLRMVVGSFLVKHLLINWTCGVKWFEECLLDSDLASNSGNWQWVAGVGIDAAPYFRIFNPITQGTKFDPKGDYVRNFVPELKHLPLEYLFSPWEAPEDVLKAAKIKLGTDYPYPIVEHKFARERALEAYKAIKSDNLESNIKSDLKKSINYLK